MSDKSRSCPKCKKMLAAAEKICPGCGLNIKRRTVLNISIILLGVAVLIGMFIKGAEEKRASIRADCKQSAQCWGNKNKRLFFDYCGYAMEQQARFAFRWIDDAARPKFSNFTWLDQENMKFTASGKSLQFQSKDGAWRTMTYECDFDMANRKVLGVRVE